VRRSRPEEKARAGAEDEKAGRLRMRKVWMRARVPWWGVEKPVGGGADDEKAGYR